LDPSNCRLLDPLETVFAGVGDGSTAILVLGFESADHPLQAWMTRALELVSDHGGSYDADAVARSWPDGRREHRSGAAGAWRNAFVRMPYWRDPAVGLGVIWTPSRLRSPGSDSALSTRASKPILHAQSGRPPGRTCSFPAD
jgi:alkyldihydroxyacetonephosphate synthase